MDALIFAAGLGTRLRPLTNRIPKALVPVGGVPMLERVARRLIAAGADRLIVNTHHHADAVHRFIEERNSFGVEVRISHEAERVLETGGGLRFAERHVRTDAPFFAHNADVLTTIPLEAMYARHRGSALATLAVQERDASRLLAFDRDGLCGRIDVRKGSEEWAREPRSNVVRVGFTGVHVLSPSIFDEITEEGVFSITEVYLRLAGEGARILPYRADDALWMDIGTPERLAEAEKAVTAGTV